MQGKFSSLLVVNTISPSVIVKSYFLEILFRAETKRYKVTLAFCLILLGSKDISKDICTMLPVRGNELQEKLMIKKNELLLQ